MKTKHFNINGTEYLTIYRLSTYDVFTRATDPNHHDWRCEEEGWTYLFTASSLKTAKNQIESFGKHKKPTFQNGDEFNSCQLGTN